MKTFNEYIFEAIAIGKEYEINKFDTLKNMRTPTSVKVVDYIKKAGKDPQVVYSLDGKEKSVSAKVFKKMMAESLVTEQTFEKIERGEFHDLINDFGLKLDKTIKGTDTYTRKDGKVKAEYYDGLYTITTTDAKAIKALKKMGITEAKAPTGKLNKDGEIEMTSKSLNKVHKDYKTVIDGTNYVMQYGSDNKLALHPVKIVESVEVTEAADGLNEETITEAKVDLDKLYKDIDDEMFATFDSMTAKAKLNPKEMEYILAKLSKEMTDQHKDYVKKAKNFKESVINK